jgi:hypothetical protein
MEKIAHHVENIAGNVVHAGARRIEIKVVESMKEDKLTIEICHDAPGYSSVTREEPSDSGTTAEAVRKAGVGVYRLTGAAQEAGGEWAVESSPTGGTQIRASFRLSHPERQPLGPIEETFQRLIAAHPEIEFRLEYTTADTTQTWDTAAAKDFGETRPPTRVDDDGVDPS